MARILIVDDDEILAEILIDVLAAAGHSASAVHHGDDALRAIDESGADLLILDYDLPGASGLEVLRQVRRHPQGLHVLVMMLTAKSGKLLAVRAHHDDVDDYLVKPVTPELLVRRVEALLRSGALARQVSHPAS
ncbi:MAG: response regulator [Sphingomonas bacterium]|uniref:response regulator transcription factor n=1 Tax=Sphingomonas bacterium TaxID=1895847 RepID=UPI002630A357|nr:response regulator [Sphingomonas bacterium]MDB5694761.1 response regulator [Sphingomonas bacterium]